jgi:hypothetical protein
MTQDNLCKSGRTSRKVQFFFLKNIKVISSPSLEKNHTLPINKENEGKTTDSGYSNGKTKPD